MRKKLNLTQTNLKGMKKLEFSKIRGGGDLCTCGCCGSSSKVTNGISNNDGGMQSKCPPHLEPAG